MSKLNRALDALRAFLTHPTDSNADTLGPYLAADVVVSVHTTNENGREAAIKALQQSLFHNVVYGGQWGDPESDGDTVTQLLSMPEKAIASGCAFRFSFNDAMEVREIFGEWKLPPAQLTAERVALTTAMRNKINSAQEQGMPVLLAYLTAAGSPEQMYRSSIQVHGDDQLAFWNPRPNGSFLESVSGNPQLSAIYRDSVTHEMMELSGRARIVDDESEARAIYDARQDVVSKDDPGRSGVAVVVDIDRITGLIHSAETGAIERILMAR